LKQKTTDNWTKHGHNAGLDFVCRYKLRNSN